MSFLGVGGLPLDPGPGPGLVYRLQEAGVAVAPLPGPGVAALPRGRGAVIVRCGLPEVALSPRNLGQPPPATGLALYAVSVTLRPLGSGLSPVSRPRVALSSLALSGQRVGGRVREDAAGPRPRGRIEPLETVSITARLASRLQSLIFLVEVEGGVVSLSPVPGSIVRHDGVIEDVLPVTAGVIILGNPP